MLGIQTDFSDLYLVLPVAFDYDCEWLLILAQQRSPRAQSGDVLHTLVGEYRNDESFPFHLRICGFVRCLQKFIQRCP